MGWLAQTDSGFLVHCQSWDLLQFDMKSFSQGFDHFGPRSLCWDPQKSPLPAVYSGKVQMWWWLSDKEHTHSMDTIRPKYYNNIQLVNVTADRNHTHRFQEMLTSCLWKITENTKHLSQQWTQMNILVLLPVACHKRMTGQWCQAFSPQKWATQKLLMLELC